MKHIVCVSGGKDSVAMLLRMLEEGRPVDKIIFVDVGAEAEFELMYPYIDKVEKYIGMPITRLKNETETFDSVFYRQNKDGKIYGFSCCPTTKPACKFRTVLKTNILEKACGKGNIVYVGIAADEPHRALRKCYQDAPNKYEFPLIEWEMPEWKCLEYCRSKGLYNPLYDYYSRLGCWQCPKQSKKSLFSTFRYFPEKWEKLKEYQSATDFPIRPGKSVFDYDQEFRHAVNTECKMEALLTSLDSERERPCYCVGGA